MANNYNAIFKRFNGTDWDTFYWATVATQVAETGDRKWLSADEKTAVGEYLSTFNAANKLVKLDSEGQLAISMIPGGLDYLPSGGGALTGDLFGMNAVFTNLGLTSSNQSFVANLSFNEGVLNAYDSFSSKDLFTVDNADDTFNVNNKRIVAVLNPENAQDVATKGYVDSLAIDGLKAMAPVKAISQGQPNITLSGHQTVDGVQLATGDRVLIVQQDDPSENGVYTVLSGEWSKVEAESQPGYYGQVLQGTNHRGTWWYCTADGVLWELHSVPDVYGTLPNGGLTLTGMNFSILDEGVTNAMLAGNIDEDKLKSISQGKITSFASSDTGSLTAASGSKTIGNHFGNLYAMIKSIKGTTNAHTVQTATLDNLASSKISSTIGTAAPSTTGRTTGDLYFQYTT